MVIAAGAAALDSHQTVGAKDLSASKGLFFLPVVPQFPGTGQ